MSFALTSFTPTLSPDPEKLATHNGNNVNDGVGSSRPASTAHAAPTSPITHRRSLSYSNPAMQPNPPAQQIYDLAMESTGNTQPNPPTSPVASNSYNTGRATRSRPATPGPSERVTPAVFTPMPDEVLFPSLIDPPKSPSF